MQEFAGKVAVVTGAASGMGLAFAHRFAEAGMKVVLADIKTEPLSMAEASLKAKGATALAVRTNVMHEEEIKRLADAAFATFGNVHIVCNNAGVSGGMGGDGVWNVPLSDWDWVLGVNFMGVLYGIREFVPRMLANGEEGHIVNTASVAGLVTGATGGPYAISKHAVVALTETLYKDFKLRGAKLSASVLCPGWVNTNIIDSERNRPEEFGKRTDLSAVPPAALAVRQFVVDLIKNGIQPEEIARQVFEAIRDDRFYIIPAQPNILDMVDTRMEDIRERRNPTIVVPISR